METRKLWRLILINILYHKIQACFFLLRSAQTMLKNKNYNIPENIRVYRFRLDDIIENKLSRLAEKQHYSL